MKTAFIIFKKELLDTLRDRRTLISMIVIPLLIFPLLIGISSRFIISHVQTAQEKNLRIGLQTSGNAEEFKSMLLQANKVQVMENLTVESGRSLIESDSLEAFIAFARDFDEQVEKLHSGNVTLYYKSTEKNDIEKQRVLEILKEYEMKLRINRFKKLNIDESTINPMKINEWNLASMKERIAEVVGGLLPYLIIIFCFMGTMYPAIDLAAGEKERGTLETILTSPANRMQILLGKFCVVLLIGIAAAIVSMIGVYVGIIQMKEIPSELLKTILGILQFRSIILLLSMLLPLTVFFAAVLLSLSFYAKSFKEAQSIISPMMIIIIVPAFIGLMPGMTLNTITALIPVLNVSLATKAIIAESASTLLLAEVYLSSIFIAGISLYICTKIFDRESTIFRGT